MKKIVSLVLVVTMIASLGCMGAFASNTSTSKLTVTVPEKYTDIVAEAIEKSEFTEEEIDTKGIFIVENTSPINLKKDIEAVWVWVALPLAGSSDISYVGFDKDEYIQAITNFVSFNGMVAPSESKIDNMIADNDLAEASEVTNLWISERVHVFAYDVICNGKEYIIPYYFTDESSFNEMKDESCVMELGKAYTVDEFVSLCEKEAELYAAYITSEREKDNRPTISLNEDGDEVIKVGGTSLDDVKSEILQNVDLMEEDTYVKIVIDSDKETFESEHRYIASSSREEMKEFVKGLFEELYLQTASGTATTVSGDSHCNIRIRYKVNGKWVLHNTTLYISDSAVMLKTENHGDIMFNVNNSDAILDYLTDYSKSKFTTYQKKTSNESTPYIRGNIEGLTKTDIIEFEFKLPSNADNSISKEVASPGKTVKGTFERYKENKYRSTYILTLSGNLGTISLCKESQSSLSGEEEIFSNNIPVAFLNTIRYENDSIVEYKVGKDSVSYDLKMVFKSGDISEVYFDDVKCSDLKYTQLTEDTKLSDEFVEKDKEVVISEAKECADTLYDFGLFKGTDKGYELEKILTREESATILVRLLGEEEKVDADDFEKVFVDVDKDRWSYAYVMYCYRHNITKGTGADTFSPDVQIDANQFITLMMRLLGYTEVNPDTALEKSVEYKLLPEEKIDELTKKKVFTRSDMVQIVYNSLKTQMDDETLFADYLLEKGILTEKEIEQIK